MLGKGDFKALIKWRAALREEVCVALVGIFTTSNVSCVQIGLDVNKKDTEELTETVEITEDVDPEQEIEDEVRSRFTAG